MGIVWNCTNESNQVGPIQIRRDEIEKTSALKIKGKERKKERTNERTRDWIFVSVETAAAQRRD